MDQGGVTWIVAADAVEARIFAERVRSGPLRELHEHHLSADDHEAGGGRASDHRHAAGGRDAAHLAEARFLKRVSNTLLVAAGRGEFDRLVLMGPPHALGALRKALPDSLAARVDATDPHARKHEDAEALRIRLREARARSSRAETAVS